MSSTAKVQGSHTDTLVELEGHNKYQVPVVDPANSQPDPIWNRARSNAPMAAEI